MPHDFSLRVYYEDTDLGGVVYYANYLKFIERGRSEWVRGLGLDQIRLKEDHGLVFAVRHIDADYLRPARFEDVLTVRTGVVTVGGARLVLDQSVLRDDTVLFSARVTLVAVSLGGSAMRLPEPLRTLLG